MDAASAAAVLPRVSGASKPLFISSGVGRISVVSLPTNDVVVGAVGIVVVPCPPLGQEVKIGIPVDGPIAGICPNLRIGPC